VRVDRLWLTDFRGYRSVDVRFAPDLTVIRGPNGHGKTNLLEALGYLASLRSFRGAPVDALVREGTEAAAVRAEVERLGRELLLEAEIRPGGRGRVQVNRQRLQRFRDLLGALQTSVFAPDDLALVKAGPGERRRFLDDTLVGLHPRHDALRSEVERILRQRNALLKQARGRRSAEVEMTLEVWNTKLAAAGEELAAARVRLLDRLVPQLAMAYDAVAQRPSEVRAEYVSAWREAGLAEALATVADEELRRGVTLAGPHRDDVALSIGGLPSRTHASQGEQRSLALALRLAAHQVVAEENGTAPVLLLDDIFSELDPGRAEALLENLPPGQTLLTTAGELPADAEPSLVLEIRDGTVRAS
jgi:DNA replication and repair protein RecF